jgi:DNA-binding transcriptional LysR family regulator
MAPQIMLAQQVLAVVVAVGSANDGVDVLMRGLYAWEFEKGGRELRVRVEGQLVLNGTTQMLKAALAGFGLAYVPEDLAQPHLAQGRLKRVL